MMAVFVLTLGGLLLVIALIGVRIILVPEGEFRGTCSTNNEFMKRKGIDCPVCGKKADEPCPSEAAAESAASTTG
jgi:hypothetical protein